MNLPEHPNLTNPETYVPLPVPDLSSSRHRNLDWRIGPDDVRGWYSAARLRVGHTRGIGFTATLQAQRKGPDGEEQYCRTEPGPVILAPDGARYALRKLMSVIHPAGVELLRRYRAHDPEVLAYFDPHSGVHELAAGRVPQDGSYGTADAKVPLVITIPAGVTQKRIESRRIPDMQARLSSVEIETTPEGEITVWPIWGEVDIVRGTGFRCVTREIAERLKAAMLAGEIFTDLFVTRNTNGDSYVHSTSRILARLMDSELRRLGF